MLSSNALGIVIISFIPSEIYRFSQLFSKYSSQLYSPTLSTFISEALILGRDLGLNLLDIGEGAGFQPTFKIAMFSYSISLWVPLYKYCSNSLSFGLSP